MFACCHRVLLLYISLGSNHFTSWRGFKVFPSIVNCTCAAWFLNDKVCSFHQGVHFCTLLTQKQSFKHSAEATAILSKGRTQSRTWPKNFSFANTWHCFTWAATTGCPSASCYEVESVPCTQFSLLTGSTNFVTKFKQQLEQPRQWSCVQPNEGILILLYLYLEYLVLKLNAIHLG